VVQALTILPNPFSRVHQNSISVRVRLRELTMIPTHCSWLRTDTSFQFPSTPTSTPLAHRITVPPPLFYKLSTAQTIHLCAATLSVLCLCVTAPTPRLRPRRVSAVYLRYSSHPSTPTTPSVSLPVWPTMMLLQLLTLNTPMQHPSATTAHVNAYTQMDLS